VEVAAAAAVMVAVAVAAAVEVAAVLHVAAVEVAAALRVSGAALELAAALQASGAALEVSVYIADAHFSDAVSAAVVVAAEAVGAAEPAGYGHPLGAGSTPAGPNLHLRVKKLASPQSKSHKRRWLRRSDESHSNPPRPRVSLVSPQKLRQLGDIRRDPPRLIAREQFAQSLLKFRQIVRRRSEPWSNRQSTSDNRFRRPSKFYVHFAVECAAICGTLRSGGSAQCPIRRQQRPGSQRHTGMFSRWLLLCRNRPSAARPFSCDRPPIAQVDLVSTVCRTYGAKSYQRRRRREAARGSIHERKARRQ
jgi:hypothetical protein